MKIGDWVKFGYSWDRAAKDRIEESNKVRFFYRLDNSDVWQIYDHMSLYYVLRWREWQIFVPVEVMKFTTVMTEREVEDHFIFEKLG